jgi:hypothetical protein
LSSGSGGGPESPRTAPRKEPRRVDAPSIRFPKVDFRESPRDKPTPPATESRQHSEGSSSVAGKPASNIAGRTASSVAGKPAPSVGRPKFYRRKDGTLIVEFPDGSTQYVRPGQQSAQASGSYR